MRQISVSMLPVHDPRVRRAVTQCVAGTIALALVTFVCFQLELHFATTA
jgi:hypothetical protein